MEPGLISAHSQGLLARITHLLGTADDDPHTVLAYLRILHSATRRKSSDWFEAIARATVRQRRMDIVYYMRSRDEVQVSVAEHTRTLRKDRNVTRWPR